MNARSLAFTLIGWCAPLLPANRAPWAAAMKAELSAIENGQAALLFAAGCVWGSVKERTLTMKFASQLVRLSTISGMVALAFVSAVIAGRFIDAHAPTAFVFGLTSALFAFATVWSYSRGPTALVQTAISMIPLYIIAYAFVSPHDAVGSEWANAKLYRALAIEGVVIWVALLAGGVFMLHAGTRSTTKRM
jgi:hypothetical protein